MRRYLATLLLCAVPVVLSGCAARVYDYHGHDYHRWNHHERVYYQQWEIQTHRGHVDYNHLNHDQQEQYWQWRDSHYGDHHHGHDHGHGG